MIANLSLSELSECTNLGSKKLKNSPKIIELMPFGHDTVKNDWIQKRPWEQEVHYEVQVSPIIFLWLTLTWFVPFLVCLYLMEEGHLSICCFIG